MKQIQLTHANFKTPIVIPSVSNIFYYYYSEVEKCVRVVSSGGAFVVVLESVETINNKIKEILK